MGLFFKHAGSYNRGGFDVVLVYREEPSQGSEGKGETFECTDKE